MAIYPVNILFLLSAMFLGVFCYNRFRAHTQNPHNKITYQYFLASFFVSISLFVYGISAFLSQDSFILSIFASVALILNAVGFNHFFLIVLYDWFSPRNYVLAKHSLHLFVAVLAILMIVTPPQSIVDTYGVIHWRFSHIVGILAAMHMDIIFGANIAILMKQFYRLKKLSIINSLALVLTFIFTGLSGSYLYMGDNSLGLFLATIGLYLGISTIFSAVIHGVMNRVLD